MPTISGSLKLSRPARRTICPGTLAVARAGDRVIEGGPTPGWPVCAREPAVNSLEDFAGDRFVELVGPPVRTSCLREAQIVLKSSICNGLLAWLLLSRSFSHHCCPRPKKETENDGSPEQTMAQ